MRPYEMSDRPGTVDCSRFGREVAHLSGYTIPRNAYAQAEWYQQHGQWITNINDAQPGDHVFWLRGHEAYHTGVIVNNILKTNGDRIIRAVQAQTFHHQPGSIQMQTLLSNGELRGFHQPFVGIGRYRH